MCISEGAGVPEALTWGSHGALNVRIFYVFSAAAKITGSWVLGITRKLRVWTLESNSSAAYYLVDLGKSLNLA